MLLPITVVYALSCCSALAQNGANTLQDELIGADRAIWQEVAGSHPNVNEVSKALAENYVDVDSGVCHSRNEVLQYLQGLTTFSFQYTHARAYVLSSTSGYVIAEMSYSSVQNGKVARGKVMTTTVFSKDHGRWKAHLHTEMDIKPETR